MIDLGNEREQKEFGPQGPVPAGSIVIVSMKVMDPGASRQAHDNPVISVAQQSGLRQLYCQFDVVAGQYEGVSWRQNITLPCREQTASLSPGHETACRIGGAMLKAILQSAGKPLQIQSYTAFTGLRFPVKVKINPRPYEKNGVCYWRNEIQTVITPDKAEYQEVKKAREIINEKGAVEATSKTPRQDDSDPFGPVVGSEQPMQRSSMDDMIF